MLLARTRQTEKAILHLKKVVEAKPDAAEARRDLGHALADKRAYREASVQLEEAQRLSGGRDPLTLHLLGRVYADLGRFPEAAATQRQALAIAVEQNNTRLLQVINAYLAQGGPAGQTPPAPGPSPTP